MKLYCCYAKGILCVYASSYGGCLCSACINGDYTNTVSTAVEWRNKI